MYNLLEKIRRNQIRKQTHLHVPLSGKHGLIIFISLLVIFLFFVWIANY